MKKYTIEFCRGSNGGFAIYTMEYDESGIMCGHRLIGPKCLGDIIRIKSFNLSTSNIDDIINQLKSVKKEMIKNNKG